MHIWVVATFWLLWTMLPQTCMVRFLCGHVSMSLKYIHLGVELLGYLVILRLTFWEPAFQTGFHSVAPATYTGPFTTSWPIFVIIYLFHYNTAILGGVEWYLTVGLTCTSLWLITLSIFPCAYWPCMYLLWRNGFADPLPIFNRISYLFCYWVVRLLYVFQIQVPHAWFVKICKKYMVCKKCFLFCGLFFTLLVVSFGAQTFLILMMSNRPIFLFKVLALTFRSLIHFELVSVYSVR